MCLSKLRACACVGGVFVCWCFYLGVCQFHMGCVLSVNVNVCLTFYRSCVFDVCKVFGVRFDIFDFGP